MTSRFDGRLKRLEAQYDTHPLDELTRDGISAVLITLEALGAGAESAAPEVTDDLLARHKMSREAFEAACAEMPPGFVSRLCAHYESVAAT